MQKGGRYVELKLVSKESRPQKIQIVEKAKNGGGVQELLKSKRLLLSRENIQ